jgi:hypothetical protein
MLRAMDIYSTGYWFIYNVLENEQFDDQVLEFTRLIKSNSRRIQRAIQEAKAFAKKEVAEYGGNETHLQGFEIVGELQLYEPSNSKLPQIVGKRNAIGAKFIEHLRTIKEEDWAEQATIDIADKVMKMSYYTAIKALEELPFFLGLHTMWVAFDDMATHQYDAFVHFTNTYHSIRAGKFWGTSEITLDSQPVKLPCWQYNTIVMGVEEFYKEGTKQNLWRLLYNNYCERFLQVYNEHYKEEGFDIETKKFVFSRVKKDAYKETFVPMPRFDKRVSDSSVEIFLRDGLLEQHEASKDLRDIDKEARGETTQVESLEDKGLRIAHMTAQNPHEKYGTLEVHRFVDGYAFWCADKRV